MARVMSFSRFLAVWLISLWLLGCASGSAETGPGPRVWIDLPLDGDTLNQSTVIVQSHASDKTGITQAELYVNGAPVRTDLNVNPADRLAKMEQPWMPPGLGDYVLIVRAKNAAGAYGSSQPARIRIEAAPSATPTPTRAPTRTGQPQDIVAASSTPTTPPRDTVTVSPTTTPTTITPVPRDVTITPSRTQTRTPTPIPTSTSTLHPATPCPGAPVISSFTASPGKITQGETSTLSWGLVSNATSVEIDHGIGGVPTPGSRAVSPGTATTYTLTARGCGGTATRQVTVLVILPASPTPTRTAVPQKPAAPSNLQQVSRACSSADQVRIAWNDNSNNETGFRIYRRIRSSNTWTAWSQRTTVGANSTQYTDGSGLSKFDDVEYGVEAYNAAGASARPTLFVSECID